MTPAALAERGYRLGSCVFDERVPRRRVGVIVEALRSEHLIPIRWEDGEFEAVSWLYCHPTGYVLTEREVRALVRQERALVAVGREMAGGRTG